MVKVFPIVMVMIAVPLSIKGFVIVMYGLLLKIGRSRAASVDVDSLVYEAIKIGYRHFDCARCYMTEDKVGNAIARHISEGNIKRQDIFITSKLFGSYHHPGSNSRLVSQLN